MNRLKQGFWIVFEGIDGVGKSTLIDLVSKEIERLGYVTIRTGEAGGTPLGRQIRQLLDFAVDRPVSLAEYLLFAADRAQHMQQVILPALVEKKLVISDRSADSSLAYQGFGRGVDRTLIAQVNAHAMQHATPDRVFYLRLPVNEALRRIEGRGGILTAFEQEQRAFFERVAHGFDEIFAGRKNVSILDATLTPQQLAALVIDELLRTLREITDGNGNA